MKLVHALLVEIGAILLIATCIQIGIQIIQTKELSFCNL